MDRCTRWAQPAGGGCDLVGLCPAGRPIAGLLEWSCEPPALAGELDPCRTGRGCMGIGGSCAFAKSCVLDRCWRQLASDPPLAALSRWIGEGGLAALQLLLGWWLWRL